jgi:hypothetical protein
VTAAAKGVALMALSVAQTAYLWVRGLVARVGERWREGVDYREVGPR